MRLSATKIRRLASKRGSSLTEVLHRASVSRTAYYSLVRRGDLLPRTAHRIAEALGVRPAAILEDPEQEAAARAAARLREARKILSRNPGVSFEDVWHVLTLLDRSPIERLQGSLVRGARTAVRP